MPLLGAQKKMFKRASLLSYAKPSNSLPFLLSMSRPYAPNTLLPASPPSSLFFPLLAFAFVKMKTYSRAGTDATVLLRVGIYLTFCASGASLVGAWTTTNVTKFDLIEIWAFRRHALMHSIAKLWRYVCFVPFRFRLFPFIEAATRRSTCAPTATCSCT